MERLKDIIKIIVVLALVAELTIALDWLFNDQFMRRVEIALFVFGVLMGTTKTGNARDLWERLKKL